MSVASRTRPATFDQIVEPIPGQRLGPGARHYALAVLAVAGALGLRWLLNDILGHASPFLVFVVAVLLAAWTGGFGPGLLATTLSAVAATFFFVRPAGSLILTNAADVLQLVIFCSIGVTVSLLNARLVSARGQVLAERQHGEEEIHKLNESLERRVVERTSQLEEANQALEAFAYSVSHDLRAPLRAMQGFAEALAEDYGDHLDDTGREYARRVVGAAGRMDLLINDLLAYSRVSRADATPQTVSLQAAVDEARQSLDPELRERGGAIRINGTLPAVRAHRPTLVQVLINLLNNAFRFVAPGVAPRVRVWAEPRGEKVRLWIEDNGIGIAPEHQERIFRVFERLHGVETYSGTGVGLGIVRKGVERMGGSSGVESAPGQGSRFWIELPPAGGSA